MASRLGYVRALDGIRGLAIAAVCGVHFFDLRGGFLGVDVFFVLSGFLITTLMLEEHDRDGSLRLAAFYRRRARRLLPALAFLLGITAVLFESIGMATGKVAESVALGLYGVNFARAFSHVAIATPLGPLWSLAQEEQFYLIWPLGLTMLLRRRSQRFIAAMLGTLFVVLVSYRIGLAVSGASWSRLYFGPDTHADGLVLGCLAAFLRREGARVHAATGGAALAILCAAFLTFNWATVAAATWGIPIAEIASVLLILAALERSTVRSALSLRPIVWLGTISYSLYLWQGYGLVAGGLMLSLPAAVMSFYLVERPILRRHGSRSELPSVDGAAPRVLPT